MDGLVLCVVGQRQAAAILDPEDLVADTAVIDEQTMIVEVERDSLVAHEQVSLHHHVRDHPDNVVILRHVERVLQSRVIARLVVPGDARDRIRPLRRQRYILWRRVREGDTVRSVEPAGKCHIYFGRCGGRGYRAADWHVHRRHVLGLAVVSIEGYCVIRKLNLFIIIKSLAFADGDHRFTPDARHISPAEAGDGVRDGALNGPRGARDSHDSPLVDYDVAVNAILIVISRRAGRGTQRSVDGNAAADLNACAAASDG